MGTERTRTGPAAAGLAVLLASAGLVAACASPSHPSGSSGSASSTPSAASPESSASPTSEGPVDRIPGLRPLLRCGKPFQRPPGKQLVIGGQFPTQASSGATAVAGSVTLTAPAAGLIGVTGGAADVFLVRDGRIVTLPPAQDSVGVPLRLAAGESHAQPARITLSACDPSLPDAALSRGTYQIWVRVTVDRNTGTPLEEFGGPWPLEVR